MSDLIDLLIKEANKSTMYRKHSACIISNNKVIAIAHNFLPKTPFQNKKSVHAEIAAINKLPDKFKTKKSNLILVVIRINNNNELMNSKPCENCEKNIKFLKKFNKILFSC